MKHIFTYLFLVCCLVCTPSFPPFFPFFPRRPEANLSQSGQCSSAQCTSHRIASCDRHSGRRRLRADTHTHTHISPRRALCAVSQTRIVCLYPFVWCDVFLLSLWPGVALAPLCCTHLLAPTHARRTRSDSSDTRHTQHHEHHTCESVSLRLWHASFSVG